MLCEVQGQDKSKDSKTEKENEMETISKKIHAQENEYEKNRKLWL